MTTETSTSAFVQAAQALVPEGQRLVTMFRERFQHAVRTKESEDWNRTSQAMTAAQNVTSSIMGLLVREAEANGAEAIRGFVVPTPDGRMVTSDYGPTRGLVLTEDGLVAKHDSWHGGASTDSEGWVRYERWDLSGRVGHGYLDPTTRQLVQSG